MTPCECGSSGFCTRHGIEKSEEMHRWCKSSNVMFNLWESGHGPGQVINHSTTVEATVPKLNTTVIEGKVVVKEGPGTYLKKKFKNLGVPPCQACNQLSERMDAWGSEGCEVHFDEIVNEIHKRAVAWFKQSKSWVDKLKAAAPEFAQKLAIESYVREAINAYKDK